MKQIRFLVLAVACVALGACATGMNDDPAFWVNATPPSDIAGIVLTANEGEVQKGSAAAARATSPAVREFAQMMVTEHTNANATARDLFAREGISPGQNSITTALTNGTETTIRNLATYDGAEFDRMYMRTQVELHQWLLSTLDTSLIPSARDADVRDLLINQRGAVASHLDRARSILNTL